MASHIDEPRGDSRERIPKNAECKIAFGVFWYSRRESNPQLTLRRGLLYPFNYGSVLFPFRRRFSFYYIIRIKSNFLSRFISFCQNISHSCRNKRCAVTAAYGKRRNLFRTVARLKKSAAGFRPAALFYGAGNENRTRNRSLGSSYFTTKLCPRINELSNVRLYSTIFFGFYQAF